MAALSRMDVEVLTALARERAGLASDVARRLGKGNGYTQVYRRRLLDAGVVSSPRNGELEFAVPFLADYLAGR